MLKDHSMKLVSLTLFHSLFSFSTSLCFLLLAQAFNQFSPYVAFITHYSGKKKKEASSFCCPPSFFLGSGCFWKEGWMHLQWWDMRRWMREGSKSCVGFVEYMIVTQQSQTDLFLCLRSSFLLRLRLEELVGWKGTELWVKELQSPTKPAEAPGSLTANATPSLWDKCIQVRATFHLNVFEPMETESVTIRIS